MRAMRVGGIAVGLMLVLGACSDDPQRAGEARQAAPVDTARAGEALEGVVTAVNRYLDEALNPGEPRPSSVDVLEFPNMAAVETALDDGHDDVFEAVFWPQRAPLYVAVLDAARVINPADPEGSLRSELAPVLLLVLKPGSPIPEDLGGGVTNGDTLVGQQVIDGEALRYLRQEAAVDHGQIAL